MASWRCYALGETRRTLVEIITDRTNEANGSGCTLSLASFSKMTGVSDRMIRKHLRWLEDAGVISMQRSRGKSTHEILVRTPDEDTKIKSRFEGEDAVDDTANPEPQEFRVGKASTRNNTSAYPELCDPSTRNPRGSANTLDTLETLGGPPSQGAPPKEDFLWSKAVEDPSSNTQPEETEAGLLPATVPGQEYPDEAAHADEEQERIAARKEILRPTSEPLPLASAFSIDDDEYQPTPVLDAYREETDRFPSSAAAMEAYALAKGLTVTDADRAELEDILENERDQDDEDAIEPALIDRPADEDDLHRLRAGSEIDRHGRPFALGEAPNALAMLRSDLMRARFCGRVCGQLEARHRSERADAWARIRAAILKSATQAGADPETCERLTRPLAEDVTAEMSRRAAAFAKFQHGANA